MFIEWLLHASSLFGVEREARNKGEEVSVLLELALRGRCEQISTMVSVIGKCYTK